MNGEVLMQFKSHVNGKNADVVIYPDRVEWGQQGRVSLTRLAGGAMTAGKVGIRKGGSSEMIPIKSVSSVTMQKDGLRYHKVIVICAGNTVEFRVDKADGDEAKSLLTELVLGSHQSQQT